MKKTVVMVVLSVILLLTVVANAGEAEYIGRKVFSMDGEFVEYVPFSFTVPTGCGNIRTFEYVPSYWGYNLAHWEELIPGSRTPSWGGIFKFKVDGTMCNREFSIEGEVLSQSIYGVWSGMEQEPEDLGVLVRGVGVARNHFRLSTDDRKFSYVIVYPRYGRKHTLDDLVAFASRDSGVGIMTSGSELVRLIVSDERGFLARMISPSQAKGIIIHDQIVVMVLREHY